MPGASCTDEKSFCTIEETRPCPRQGKEWCRAVILEKANANSGKIGVFSLVLGVSQILSFVLSIMILLCDVRIDSEYHDFLQEKKRAAAVASTMLENDERPIDLDLDGETPDVGPPVPQEK